jgi:hypothetical protein
VKFKHGDKTDEKHCKALQHEFFRCHDAFTEFVALATQTLSTGDNKLSAYRMYNAYARFIHHLYEFMTGALARELNDTRIAKTNQEVQAKVEQYVTSHAGRLLRNKRQAIDNVKAPGWEQALASLPPSVPPEFAARFREHRNVVSGHVKHERAALDLSDFYQRYHFYMFLLYRDAYGWWGLKGKEMPDLDAITNFSVLVKQQPPAPAAGSA